MRTKTGEKPKCSDCGGIAEVVKRIEKGFVYCDKCYPRMFIQVVCVECGKRTRDHRDETSPRCRKCRNASRRCVRCERPVPRAGLIVGGKPVCPGCVQYFKKSESCPVCSRPSTRLVAAPEAGFPLPVCERCRGIYRNATCHRCGKHRRVAGQDELGKPLCRACTGPNPESHPCPDCGREVLGGGDSRCRRCANARSVDDLARLNSAAFRQEWVRNLFVEFCRWPGLRIESPSILRRINGYADFFAEVDNSYSERSGVTPLALVERFGKETLRRYRVPVAYLTQHDSQPPAQVVEDLTERARLGVIKGRIAGEPWGEEIGAYEKYLRRPERKRLAERTIRTYLAVAEGLLREAGKDDLQALAAADLRRMVRKRPGQAASLLPFVRFLREELGLQIGKPVLRKHSPARRERRLLESTRRAVEILRTTANPREARNHLAILLANLTGLPLKQTRSLRVRDLVVEGDRVLIRGGEGNEMAEIAGEAFKLMRTWVQSFQEQALPAETS